MPDPDNPTPTVLHIDINSEQSPCAQRPLIATGTLIERMIDIVPADTGLFRNVVPKAIEDMLKKHQVAAWSNPI